MTFSEVIKVKNGVFYNLPFHQKRMNCTTLHHFAQTMDFHIVADMIPPELRTGLVKCRVVYSQCIESIEFTPYTFRRINSVAIVHDDTVEYPYKSTDRSHLNHLLEASKCDDIIIIKNGLVTDSTFANLVFEDSSGFYTPSTPLLFGTKRASLLASGTIRESKIHEKDLKNGAKIYLINAMIDLEDRVLLPIADAIF